MKHSKNDEERRGKVRRTALLLGVVALIFYLGFIVIGTVRAWDLLTPT